MSRGAVADLEGLRWARSHKYYTWLTSIWDIGQNVWSSIAEFPHDQTSVCRTCEQFSWEKGIYRLGIRALGFGESGFSKNMNRHVDAGRRRSTQVDAGRRRADKNPGNKESSCIVCIEIVRCHEDQCVTSVDWLITVFIQGVTCNDFGSEKEAALDKTLRIRCDALACVTT